MLPSIQCYCFNAAIIAGILVDDNNGTAIEYMNTPIVGGLTMSNLLKKNGKLIGEKTAGRHNLEYEHRL